MGSFASGPPGAVGMQLLPGTCASCPASSLAGCPVSCLQAASQGFKWVLSLPKTLLPLPVVSLAPPGPAPSPRSPFHGRTSYLLPSSSRDCLSHAWTCSAPVRSLCPQPTDALILLLPLGDHVLGPWALFHPSPDL